MYIVEWNDHEGNRCERVFETLDNAQQEAAWLEAVYDHVAIIAEIDV